MPAPYWLKSDSIDVPDVSLAAEDPPGLLAVGGRLTVARLEEAYRNGIFPWFSTGQPVLWWSPDPRMVLPVAEFRLSQSLRKTLRRFVHTPGCEVRIDSAFRDVIEACAQAPRDGQDGTWIVPAMVQAYCDWHGDWHGNPDAVRPRGSRPHSIETWIGGELVGGLYGVAIGGMFFGESMFARRTDASKIALAALVALCRVHGVALIDCQQNTAHLASLGAREIPRRDFLAHVRSVLEAPGISDWTYDAAHWAQLGLGGPRSSTEDPA
jgi:leucyl/phenylalanyl-tRNA--protein transferase